MKWTSQNGHWIHGFFCCKCILTQMKIIQLGLFWLDQNCRFFVCKIDCFLESFLNPKNDQFYFEKICNFDPIEKALIEWFSFGPIYIYNKRTHEFKVQFGWFTSKPLIPIRIMCELVFWWRKKNLSKQNTMVVWPVYIDTRIFALQTVSTIWHWFRDTYTLCARFCSIIS